MGRFLLFEDSLKEIAIITEKSELSKDKKNYFIEGIFIQEEERNQNGRIYPKIIMEPEVQIMQENIKNKFRCTGELDHPEYIEIRLKEAAHMLVDLKRHENTNYYYGKSKILDDPIKFPKGQTVIGLIEEGIKFGVSTRGVGDLDNNGIVTDYQLITVDIVADPSAQPAIMDAVYENRGEWYKRGIIDLKMYNKVDKLQKDNKYYHKTLKELDDFFINLIK